MKKAADIRLIVYDFDGVMTDNHVYVDQEGRTQVLGAQDGKSEDHAEEEAPDHGRRIAVHGGIDSSLTQYRRQRPGYRQPGHEA